MRLCMPCENRLGLLRDISKTLANLAINISSVEVQNGALYLECDIGLKEQKATVLQILKKIDGIHQVLEVPSMPSKEQAEQLQAVLTSVQDGVLAVNHEGILKQCNPAASRTLQLSASSIGKPLTPALARDLLIARTLSKGCLIRNREVFIENINKYCVITTMPLYNDHREIVGAVTMVRDSGEVRDLVQKMTASLPVTFLDISFASPAMAEVLEQARRYAVSESTVLIRGETGTGKEMFARALHSASPRANKTFLPINCAAIPDTLLESELFGYEDGAFTGASKGGKPGLFELANGGTLFLDEIGEISVHLQAKLLRVLQEKRIRRIGSSRELPIDVRLITATHRNLEEMVDRQLFREDLYYRLNVIPLYLPPLRKRKEDIAILAEHFLKRFAAKLHKSAKTISPQAMEKLRNYHWPGNVRELENIIERAVNLVDGPIIQADHIHLGQRSPRPADAAIQFENYQTLEERLGEVEREILKETIKRFRSSRRAGAVLGLSHTAIIRRLKKYGLWQENAFSSH